MRTAIRALFWERWRDTKTIVITLCLLGPAAAIYDDPRLWGASGLIGFYVGACYFILILGSFLTHNGQSEAQSQQMLRWNFRPPMRTSKLVVCRLAYSITVWILLLGEGWMLMRVFAFPWQAHSADWCDRILPSACLVGGAGIAYLEIFVCLNLGRAQGKTLCNVLAVVTLPCVVGTLVLLTRDRPISAAIISAALIPGCYLLAVGIAILQRRGGMVSPLAYIELSPIQWRRVRTAHFPSRTRALLWLEWSTGGHLLPLLASMLLVVCVPFPRTALNGLAVVIENPGVIYVLALPFLLLGPALDNSMEASRQSLAFLRPVSTRQLAVARMRTCLAVLGAGFTLLAVAIIYVCAWGYANGEAHTLRSAFLGGPSGAGLRVIWSILGCALLAWIALTNTVLVGTNLGLLVLMMLPEVVLEWLGHTPTRLEKDLAWSVVSGFLMLVIIRSLRYAWRERLVERKDFGYALGVFTLVFSVLMVNLWPHASAAFPSDPYAPVEAAFSWFAVLLQVALIGLFAATPVIIESVNIHRARHW